jgi:transcriptional regulator with XRE-family HTH domain
MNQNLLLPLRIAKGLDQAQAAERIGIPQPRLSLYETLNRMLPDEYEDAAEHALALGEPVEGEAERLVYALGFVRDRTVIELLFDDQLRLGIYRDRTNAEAAALPLRKIGRLQVFATPLWLSFAAVKAFDRRGRADPDALFVVDLDPDLEQRTLGTLDYVAGIVRGRFATRDRTEQARQIAAATRRTLDDASAGRRRRRHVEEPHA